MGFENQLFGITNLGGEIPDIDQLREIAECICPAEEGPQLASGLIKDELNLQGVYESLARLSGKGTGLPDVPESAAEGFSFNPGIFPGGLPVGDELKALLIIKPKNNLQSGAEEVFTSSTFSDRLCILRA